MRAIERTRLFLATCVVLLMVAVAASCTRTPPESTGYPSNGAIVPADTLQDLVTYGDIATVFTIVGEEEVPPSAEESEQGDGTIGRHVVARQSGPVRWQRPSRKIETAAPSSWTIAAGGWVVNNDQTKTRTSEEGLANLEMGRTYLAIRTYSSIAGTPSEWFSLRYLPLINGVVDLPADLLSETASDINLFQGLTVEAASTLLAETPPDTRALPYMNLDAFERYQKLVA